MIQWVTSGGQWARSRGPGATAFQKGLGPAPCHEEGRRGRGWTSTRDVTSSEHDFTETQKGASPGLLGAPTQQLGRDEGPGGPLRLPLCSPPSPSVARNGGLTIRETVEETPPDPDGKDQQTATDRQGRGGHWVDSQVPFSLHGCATGL